MTTPTSHPFYLDCDTGIDDALALAYLLASPQADVRGIGTVSGNVSAAVGARNTLDLLQLAGHAHIPVALGAHDPQAGSFHGGAPHVHGANGIGEVSLSTAAAELAPETAAEMLVRLAHEHPGTLRILAIGPLTNIAEALRLDPELPRLVQDITIMGGAAFAPGNITAVAEANIANDPEAAADVLAADWDVTLVPLDVTMSNVLEESHRQELLAVGPSGPAGAGGDAGLLLPLLREPVRPGLLGDARPPRRGPRGGRRQRRGGPGGDGRRRHHRRSRPRPDHLRPPRTVHGLPGAARRPLPGGAGARRRLRAAPGGGAAVVSAESTTAAVAVGAAVA